MGFDVIKGGFRRGRGTVYSPILLSHGPLTREQAIAVQQQACLLNDTSWVGCERAIKQAKKALEFS